LKELIDLHQAWVLMIGVLVAAPIFGLLVGALRRKLLTGLLIGLAIGVGNLALWTVYNAITNRLGLDTVKNLLVNLALFAGVGIAVGAAIAWRANRAAKEK
jgi:hypothetical protein